ncbi:MAG: D-ribose transporter ATP-binding protein [Bacteriovoracaceae bacterium]|nr:D-ribose transporter ATP-binding protein [Bacteriovoracaceae bacterium]
MYEQLSDFKIDPVLVLQGTKKSFGLQPILKGVRFRIYPGEVVGLIGANGAGKSTLMKIISGALRPDDGRILWKSKRVRFSSPAEAYREGIYMIPQELGLMKDLNAVDNMMLGREPSLFGFVQNRLARYETKEALKRVGAHIPLDLPVSFFSPGVQQQIAIARSLLFDTKLLILDEPTSMLTDGEAEKLFQLIKEAKRRGTAVIYITHRLNELSRISDRVVAIRDGKISGEGKTKEVSETQMVKWMVGDAFESAHRKANRHYGEHKPSKVVLEVNELATKLIQNVSFKLHEGEILGVLGLMGSGRTEMMRALSGVDVVHQGRILVDGKPIKTGSVRDAIKNGILMAPEDRRQQGLFLDQTVGFNALISNTEKFSYESGFVRLWSERNAYEMLCSKMSNQISKDWQRTDTLSGGNQQRLILGKILMKDARILLLDEVTTGVDVMTKAEILEKMVSLAQEGKSIIFVSSDWEEVTEIADRVLLIKNGTVEKELDRSAFDNEAIMSILVSREVSRKVAS